MNAILERLQGLDFDGQEENLRCLVEIARPVREGYSRALDDLEGVAQDGDAAALKGRLLTHLGRLDEAAAVLEAAGSSGGRFPARAWLGQALLLAGRFEEAAAALDAALAEDPGYPWAWFSRGAARLVLGQPELARADADQFLGKAGKTAAALALSAVTAAQQGETARGLGELEETARLCPGQAWPFGLKSVLLRGAGKLAAARDALGEALEVQPSAWLHEQRARVWEDLGDLPRALEDAAAALRSCPCEAHRLYKAHLHTCWREYDLAAVEYGEALAEDPGRADLLFLRSKMLSTLGRLDEAHRDAAAAASLEPSNDDLAFWEIQLEVLLCRETEAVGRLDAMAAPAAAREPVRAKAFFYGAYAGMYGRRWEDARRDLDRCLALDAGDALRQKAGFYRAVAAGVAEQRPAGREAPELYLLGLGVDPPFTATLEALRAAGRCEVVFNNVTGEEMFELLRLFCRDVRPLAYHQNDDEERLAREILAEVRPGRSVGFVTRGHATIYGGLGRELIARCAKAGRSFRNLPSMSSADLFAARHGARGDRAGLLVLDGLAAAKTPALLNPAVPLVLYVGSNMQASRFLSLCESLEAGYGPAHPCLVFDHRVDQVPQRLRMDAVSRVWEQLSPSAIFYVPGPEAHS